jgi:hypothetical protein
MDMMATNNISVITVVRYMDDIRAFLHAIRAGWRMWEGRPCFCEEWKLEDIKDGKSATRRTAEILISIMNQVMPFLQFTVEIGEDFIDLKLPTLDVKLGSRTVGLSMTSLKRPWPTTPSSTPRLHRAR